jgi:hypothetical protein
MKTPTYQGSNEHSEDQGNDICPDWKSDVLLQNNHKTKNETDYENNDVPPPWSLLVMLNHVCVVTIIVSTLSHALESSDDISAPEEEAMEDQSTDLTPED